MTQPLKEPGRSRFFPHELDVGDPPGKEHQVQRSIAPDLVGDVDVTTLGVPGLRHSCHQDSLTDTDADVRRDLAV